jgi:RES domain-containing protein
MELSIRGDAMRDLMRISTPASHKRAWREPRFWRICRLRYVAEAASGEGTRLYGGRWNRRGVRVVYVSTSLALAAVETFVNLELNLIPADLVLRTNEPAYGPTVMSTPDCVGRPL